MIHVNFKDITNEYFFFSLLTDHAQTQENLKKLEDRLNKEQDEFIENIFSKKNEIKPAVSDMDMENLGQHSALNALIKNTNGQFDFVDSSYVFVELDKT